jgi:hypothetical protein
VWQIAPPKLMKCGILTQSLIGNGKAGFGGDGGQAIESRLHLPLYISLDKNDNLLISAAGNFRLRRVDSKTGM